MKKSLIFQANPNMLIKQRITYQRINVESATDESEELMGRIGDPE